MNPLRPSSLLRTSALLFALLCIAASETHAQIMVQAKEATALEKLANIFGDALKAATGKDVKKKPVQRVRAQPLVPQVLPAAAQIEQRKERLEAYADVGHEWMNFHLELTDVQKKTLSDAFDRAITASQKAAKKPQAANQRLNRNLSDHFVVKFTDSQGAAWNLDFARYKRRMNVVDLTSRQERTLEEVAKERKEFHQSAALGHVMNILDGELFFTPRQRQILAREACTKLDLTASCYSLKPQNYYFQQTTIVPILQRGDHLKFLSDAQKKRAVDLTNTDRRSASSEQYISFQSNEGVDAWQEKLGKASKSQRDRIMRAVGVRVDFHQTLCRLEDSTARHLQVAGKGATDDVIARWKVTARKQLKTYEQHAAQWGGNGNFSFSIPVADVQQLEANEIWKHTIESLDSTTNEKLAARNNVRQQATAEFIVSMLDKELWLTKKQRESLIESVRGKLPSPDYKIQNSAYFLEVTLLTIPLFKLSKQDLSVLSPAQMRAWEAMKKPFQLNGSYVMVTMNNGGQMHITVPK